MLDNSAERADIIQIEERGTTPNWSGLEQAVEELLDVLGATHVFEDHESSEHLTHLERFDWAKAFRQGSSILRRR
jgi:hypothetical protein